MRKKDVTLTITIRDDLADRFFQMSKDWDPTRKRVTAKFRNKIAKIVWLMGLHCLSGDFEKIQRLAKPVSFRENKKRRKKARRGK